VDFAKHLITIHDIVKHLHAIEEIDCDVDLEAYLHMECEKQGIMTNLKIINGVSVDVLQLTARGKEKKILKVGQELSKFVGSYSVGIGAALSSVFYV